MAAAAKVLASLYPEGWDFQFSRLNYQPPVFTPEEKEIVDWFFTNSDKNVYAMRYLPPEIVMALITRQSQTNIGPRELLVRGDEGKWLKARALVQPIGGGKTPLSLAQFLNIDEARSLFRRVFVGWGHIQPGKIVVIPFGMEEISQLAAKAVEPWPFLWVLERSTRFNQFTGDPKENRRRYVRPPEIANSRMKGEYEDLMDFLLRTNAELIEKILPAIREKYAGRMDEKEMRRKAYDLCRGCLPMALKTNLAGIASLLQVEETCLDLAFSEQQEIRELGAGLARAAEDFMPGSLARIAGDWGKSQYGFRRQQRACRRGIAIDGHSSADIVCPGPGVAEIIGAKEADSYLSAQIIWEMGKWDKSFADCLKFCLGLPPEKRRKIIKDYIGPRENLSHSPGRALEAIWLRLTSFIPVAIWRDLARHLVGNSQYRQALKPIYGWANEEELFALLPEAEKILEEVHRRTTRVYWGIAEEVSPAAAEYAITFDTLMPWMITVNLKELVYICERRSAVGGDPSYRRWAQQVALAVVRENPALADLFSLISRDKLGEWRWQKNH